ncbi:hypothetical protein D918_01892 [Trichuris suis]|nr:hypothetical protein D918_01892 [Trichuris suis]
MANSLCSFILSGRYFESISVKPIRPTPPTADALKGRIDALLLRFAHRCSDGICGVPPADP